MFSCQRPFSCLQHWARGVDCAAAVPPLTSTAAAAASNNNPEKRMCPPNPNAPSIARREAGALALDDLDNLFRHRIDDQHLVGKLCVVIVLQHRDVVDQRAR